MPHFPSLYLKKKLFSYGILTPLCISLSFSCLNAEDSIKKKSLVILENSSLPKKNPQEFNLQEKIQFLTTLNNEQAERIQILKEELEHLKNKLHLAQLSTMSSEKGNFKQLYAALKNEFNLHKENQKQLEKIIADLKSEKESERKKNIEAQNQIAQLMGDLKQQSQILENIEDNYKEELSHLKSAANESESHKQLSLKLQQEVGHYQETHEKLELLVQQLKAENEIEKNKIQQAEDHIKNLMAALEEQNHSLESIQGQNQYQLAQLSGTQEESESYKTLNLQLKSDLAKAQEAHRELESLIHKLKDENEIEKEKLHDTESYIGVLLAALNEQTLSYENLKESHENHLVQHTSALDVKVALEKELAQTKESHQQLQSFLEKLQLENAEEKQKILESETRIATLMTALDAIQETHRQEIETLLTSKEPTQLQHELSQNKQAQERLEKLIQALKEESLLEKNKTKETENYITSLIALLADQSHSLESLVGSEDINEKFHALQIAYQQLKEQFSADQLKLNEAEAYISSLIDSIKEQSSSIEFLQNHQEQTLSQLQQSQEGIHHFQELRQQLERELVAAKEAQNHLEKLIENQKKELTIHEQLASALVTVIDAQDLSLNHWQNQHQKERNLNSHVHAQIQAYEKELSLSIDQLSKLQNELLAHKNTTEIQTRQYDLLSKTLNDQQISHQKALQNIFEDWESLYAVSEASQNAHQTQVQGLKAQLENLELDKQTLLSSLEFNKKEDNEKNLIALREQEDNWSLELKRLENAYEVAFQKHYSLSNDQLSKLYSALEEEQTLDYLAHNLKNQTIQNYALQIHLLEQSLDSLQKEHNLNLQHIAQLQLTNSNHINHHLSQQAIQNAQVVEAKQATVKAHEDLSQLLTALESAHLQQSFLLSDAQFEKEVRINGLLKQLEEEKAQTLNLQKNLNEIQQMYDQTAALYNEMYMDHTRAQKQIEHLHLTIEENKTHQVAEADQFLLKIESLQHELEQNHARTHDLHHQLTAALEDNEQLKHLKQRYGELEKEKEQLLANQLDYLQSLSLQDDLINQSNHEMRHHQKVIEEQAHILQELYKEKYHLIAQIEALPKANEVQQLQLFHDELKEEHSRLKTAYLDQLHINAWHEDTMKNAQSEIAQKNNLLSDKEELIKQHLEEKEVLNQLVADQTDDIRQLNLQINRAEKIVQEQLKELSDKYESQKTRNTELQKQLANLSNQEENYQKLIQELQLELSTTQALLSTKAQSGYAQQQDLEKIQDHLTALQSENADLKKIAEEFKELQALLLTKNQMLEKHEADKENMEFQQQQLTDKMHKLAQDKQNYKAQYELALANQDELKTALEKNLKELMTHKNSLEQSQKIHQEHAEALEKLKLADQRMTDLTQDLSYIKQAHEKEKSALEEKYQKMLAEQKEDNARKNSELNEHRAVLQDLNQQHLELKSELSQAQLMQKENEKLKEELSTLKQQIETFKTQASQQEMTKATALQVERLQEALQQILHEKTILQSQYQDQLVTEKILSDRLEETLAELDHYKENSNKNF